MNCLRHKEVPPKKFVGHTGKVISLAVKQANLLDHVKGVERFISGSSDGTIRVWNVKRDSEIVNVNVDVIAASPKGEYLVSGSYDGTVSVWRIETGELVLGPLEGHSDSVTSLSFSPDGLHFASGSYDGTVRIWNLNSDRVTCSTEGQEVRAICFSPDGKHVASGSKNTIQVWGSKSGELTLKIFEEEHSGLISSICYSPDGNRIVSEAGDKDIHIWDASDGTLLLTLQGHLDKITSVNYSHDGSYILSVSRDGTVRFWDSDSGKPVREPVKVQEHSMVRVYISPDDTYFISGSFGERTLLWKLSTGEPFRVDESSSIGSLVFLPSPDSKCIKFASVSNRDKLVRVYCWHVDARGTIFRPPNRDGWLFDNDGNLLSWVPSDKSYPLIYGSCIRILNSRFLTKLTLSKYQGSQWTSCFPSSGTI